MSLTQSIQGLSLQYGTKNVVLYINVDGVNQNNIIRVMDSLKEYHCEVELVSGNATNQMIEKLTGIPHNKTFERGTDYHGERFIIFYAPKEIHVILNKNLSDV